MISGSALEVSQRMTPLLKLTWEAAADRFAPRVGLDPDEWSVINPHTERMIGEAALAFCDSTNATTSLKLDAALEATRKALTEGVVKEGEALPALTKRIMAIFDGAEKWRARAIAQTETSRAVHAAQEAAAIASGVVTGWEWLLSADACPMCVAIYQRCPAVQLGHVFAVIGDNPHYSHIKFPPLHPHCNCAVQEVLDTDPQPQWSDTLHQPGPATAEEHDAAAVRQTELIGSVFPVKPPPPAAVRPKPAVRPRPAPPRPDPVELAREEQRQANADHARQFPVTLIPVTTNQQIDIWEKFAAEYDQEAIGLARKKADGADAWKKAEDEAEKCKAKMWDYGLSKATRKKWEKRYDELIKSPEYLRLRDEVKDADYRIDYARKRAENYRADAEIERRNLKPIRIEYARNQATHPDLIPPGPIADRIGRYTLGDAKIEKLLKVGETFEKQENKLATVRSDLSQRIDRAQLRFAELFGKAEADRTPEEASEMRRIEADLMRDGKTLDKVKAAQKSLDDRRADAVARILAVDLADRAAFKTRSCDAGAYTVEYENGNVTKDPLYPPTAGTRVEAGKATGWLSRVMAKGDGDFRDEMDLKIGERAGARAHHKSNDAKDNYNILARPGQSADVIVHEFGHAFDAGIKTGSDKVLERSLEFKEHRLKGQASVELRSLYPWYDPGEKGADDDFGKAFPGSSAWYVGKDYGRYATEIVSMGIQQMYNNAAYFAKNDPEYCKLIMGIMDGSLR